MHPDMNAPFFTLEISRVSFGDPKPSGFCCLVDVPFFEATKQVKPSWHHFLPIDP